MLQLPHNGNQIRIMDLKRKKYTIQPNRQALTEAGISANFPLIWVLK